MFLICLDDCLVEQIAQKVVAGQFKVDLVCLGQVCFFPFGHGTETTHDAELVPYAGSVLFGQGEECLAGHVTIGVLHIAFFLDLAEHVVVGLENNGCVGVHLFNAGNQFVVVVTELFVVKAFHVGVVNADGENDEVRLVVGQFLFETGADFFKVVVNLGAVNAYAGIGNARVVGFGQDTCERKAGACVLLYGIGNDFCFGNAVLVGVVGGIQFAFGVVDCRLVYHVGTATGTLGAGFFSGEAGGVQNVAFTLEHGISGHFG